MAAESLESPEPVLPDEDLETVPLVPLREAVVFPRVIMPLQVGRPKSVRALEAALRRDKRILLVTQIDPSIDEIRPDNLYRVGTVAELARIRQSPDGTTQMLVQGLSRVQIVRFGQEDPYVTAQIRELPEPTLDPLEGEALMRSVRSLFEQYAELGGGVIPELTMAARNATEPGYLADLVSAIPELTLAQRQSLLEIVDPGERLRWLAGFLIKENDVLTLKSKITEEVHREIERGQKHHLLREQMRAIQRELGEDDPQVSEAAELRQKIEQSGMPEDVRARALKEVERLSRIPTMSPEVGVIRTYVDWLIELPWGSYTEDRLDIGEAAAVLDADHYGLPKVKDRILEYLAVRKLAPELRSPILCFVGPPGVGKTSLGRSIARALGRKFVRVSLGGMRDEAEIRGHRRTYIGALPGRIIQSLKTAGSANPVFMIDEIDKVGMDFRGDPASALLEVLDPEQNESFTDHYLEVPFDLSRVVFIATANVLHTIPPPLRDRMEVIELPGYTEDEKIEIGERHLLPKQLAQHGLKAGSIDGSDGAEASLTITPEALRVVLREYTREAGVRNLEREIANICRKAARRIAEGGASEVVVEAADVPEYLGPARFEFGTAEGEDQVGVATGLAWTEGGGDTMPVEVTFMPGKGELILTGQLGKVMEESARAAASYARARSESWRVEPDFFETHSLHIHVPAGAIPKDGPSAGITMATAIISALTGRPVRCDVAMTGEITLRGRVLPIGGLKEKALAAHRAGIRHMIIPRKNEKDLVELAEEIRREMTFLPVSDVQEVLNLGLRPKAREAQPRDRGTARRRGATASARRAPVKRPAASR
ncbi:MAG TPA: endopeptidase La [Dehalococcoidia bacterium]|nr:endopeptidase La [Dehalococcoidia bacterium]